MSSFKNKPDPKNFRFIKSDSKPGAVLVKHPGQINGLQFLIEDLDGCTVHVMDRSECTTVDYCNDCVIVLGPVEGSLFVRNCKNVVIHAACRQFRARECENCEVHLWCATEPVIEASHGITFSTWDVAYPKLGEHFRALKMDPLDNHFGNEKKIFDFHKDDPAYPLPHYTVAEPSPFKVMVLESPEHGEPENPVPLPDGSAWAPARLGSPPKASPAQQPARPPFLPKRFALKFSPPTMVLEYEDTATGETAVLNMEVDVTKQSNVPDVVNNLYSLFPQHINSRSVKKAQLIRLVSMLKDKL
jgi:hypothetical protein